MSDDPVNNWVDIELLREIAECASRISHLFRKLVAPFLDPDVLLGGKQIIINSQKQEEYYGLLLHELEALNSLITGVNRNKEKNAPFPKSAQRAIKDTAISFNTVKEYMILASETYFESGKTEKETDLYEKSRKAAIECRPKIKYLADLLIEHKKLFGDETDVSELYVVYKDWKG